MGRCGFCSAEMATGARYCPSCGRAIDDDPDATRASDSLLTSAPSDGARFVPGALLADRYRIVALLGRGGMGEVYRADDLKLGQAVALKFLPPSLARDPSALARFHREVRVARQISHPNVCRVFDIGEAFGQSFLCMEYIDGEDLASLLRRIGRIQSDKAIEIARQVCAGLSAAHDAGVLHRDLKPANVMIDGRGRARLTDFGLAGLETEAGANELASGTPAYMSPEQLAGKEITRRSEIYSLGLLLHELFTGKRVFDAKSLPELKRQRDSLTVVSASTVVKDLDPLIDSIIRRCLEADPELRPETALRVSAALPGGDPLEAALAAGETPSPEMVAAAPTRGALSRRAALRSCVLSLLLLIVLILGDGANLIHRVPLEKSPEVLADRAQSILARVPGSGHSRYRAYAIEQDESYFGYEHDPLPPPQKWQRLGAGQPAVYYFWYREGRAPFNPANAREGAFVSENDPPLSSEDQSRLRLDLKGRLLEFVSVPPAMMLPGESDSAAVDWGPLFEAAGLDRSKLADASPTWTPPVFADSRAAWTGAFADHADLPLRIEAASYRGRPVYFRIVAPWDIAPTAAAPANGAATTLALALTVLLISVTVVGAAGLARRNLFEGRGDQSGAMKVAFLGFALEAVATLLGARASISLENLIALLVSTAGSSLLSGALFWLFYIALEPSVRRARPELLVGWTRLLSGKWRDPMVGRDVLLGLNLGMLAAAVQCLSGWLKEWTGNPKPPNHFLEIRMLGGLAQVIAVVFWQAIGAVWLQLSILLILALIYGRLRRERTSALVLWGLIVLLQVLWYARSWPVVMSVMVVTGLMILAVARFGLIAGLAFHLAYFLMMLTPLTTELTAWYAKGTIVVAGLFLLLLVFGARTAAGDLPRGARHLIG